VSYTKDCNKPSGSTKDGEVLDQLIDYELLKDLVHLTKTHTHITCKPHHQAIHTKYNVSNVKKLLMKCGSGL